MNITGRRVSFGQALTAPAPAPLVTAPVTHPSRNTLIYPGTVKSNVPLYPGLQIPEPSRMLRRAANIMTPTAEQPPPLSPRRRLSQSIRRRLGRFGRSKSSEVVHESSGSEEMIPKNLQEGILLTKISNKKQRKMMFRLDPEQGHLRWESKVKKYIPIEAVKELRSGVEAKYYRDQFQPPSANYEHRWLTIIYIADSTYKSMHLIAPTAEVMEIWSTALRRLHAIRTELMNGLGQGEMLEAVWERHYWNGRGFTFEDVEKLCKRLNVSHGEEELRRLFQLADADKNGRLEFEDFGRFVKLLKARPDIERLYKKLIKHQGCFNFEVFQRFMKDAQRSKLETVELQALFDSYSSDAGSAGALVIPGAPSGAPQTLSLESFTSFLLSADNPTFVDCEEPPPLSADHHHHHQKHHHPATHSKITNGHKAIEVAYSSPPIIAHDGIGHDMSRPLSEYYISSSHNTYLVGHQLVGESTIEGYVRALQAGCRCVELDIHPGNPAPLITHGKTLTSKISVREVCDAIKQWAFWASPYPLIISAEIHCSPAQQDQVVEIMTEVFGDQLVQAPVNGRPPIEELPSPDDLRGRIMLKAKNLYISREAPLVGGAPNGTGDVHTYTSPESTAEDSEKTGKIDEVRMIPTAAPPLSPPPNRRNSSASGLDLKREPLLQKASAAIQRVRSRSGKGHSNSQSSESSPPSSFTPLTPRSNSDITKPKMSFALLSLLVYTVGVKYRGINKKEEYAPQHMFSLSENTANKMIRSGALMDAIKHNRTHLVRIYPKGTRLKSSNYLPHGYWSAGAQLVAINWQTPDLGYTINHAMFQRNGGSGYVLKPRALRLPNQKELLAKKTEHVFEVGIISAQQLPPPKDASPGGSTVDPFVEVSLHVPDWSAFHQHHAGTDIAQGAGPPSPPPPPATQTSWLRTSSVKNNGFNPVWEEKLRIPFSCVGDMMDLIFVRFVVRQDGDKEDDEPLAVYCAPLACLQQGYRHLPLHDTQLAQYMFSTLFVKISIR